MGKLSRYRFSLFQPQYDYRVLPTEIRSRSSTLMMNVLSIDPPTNLTLSHTNVSVGGLGSGNGILVSLTPSDDGYATSTVILYSSDGGNTWTSGGTGVPNG